MDQPLVSIILPVYNAQNHLARCIGSILNQTYKNIELIILNDGSKDQSLPVCEAFRAKDERIVLVDKENSGVSDTRNLGLKLAGIRDHELETAMSRAGSTDVNVLLDDLSRALTNKFTAELYKNLREASRDGRIDMCNAAVDLFGLRDVE